MNTNLQDSLEQHTSITHEQDKKDSNNHYQCFVTL